MAMPPVDGEALRQAVLNQLYLSFAGACDQEKDAATDATVAAAGVPLDLLKQARGEGCEPDEQPLWWWLQAWKAGT